MVHFRAQVQSRDAATVARLIASEGLLHLVDIAHGKNAQDNAPPGTAELYAAFRDLRGRVRALIGKLHLPSAEPEGALSRHDEEDFATLRERIAAELGPIESRVDAASRAATAAREQLSRLSEDLAHAERIAEAHVDAARIAAARFVTIRLALVDEETLARLGPLLSPAPYAVVALDDRKPSLVAIAIANFARQRLDETLRMSLAEPVPLPSRSIDELRRAREDAARDEHTANETMQRMAREVGPAILAIARRVDVATLLLQAQTYFAAAGRFVVISGWMPAESAARMRDRIRRAAGDNAIVDLERAEDVPGVLEGSIRVPILHRNPLVLRPFQHLVDLYGTPSYGEVQPTAFFAISFLIMFGLMFGDAGHGAVLFTAGWSLFRFLPQYLDYGILLMEAGSASALFGILYGSVFGVHTLLPTLWLEPMADLPRFMIIAVLLGAVMVTGGLVLNIINTWRSGDIRDALYGPRGISGAFLYWIVLVLLVRMFVPGTLRIPTPLIIALAGVAIVLLIGARLIAPRLGRRRPQPAVSASPAVLVLLESAIELVDTLFSFFANTISFVRVAAFAAVHAGVFIAIFAVADTLADMRGGGALSIAAHVAGNAVMILLEGLTVSVQVLRLEYYEFFGKFFRGGGERYEPLMLARADEAPLQGGRKHA